MTSPVHPSVDLAAVLAQLAQAPVGDRVAILQQHGDPDEVLRSLIQYLEGYMLVDLPAALAGANAVVETADAGGQPVSRLRARRVKAQCLSYANRFGDSLGVLDDAAAIAQQFQDRRELALVNMTRLHALARLGRFDEAVEAGESARQDLLECGEPISSAKADVNLGVVQRMRDRPAESLAHFDRAMPLFADQPMITAQIQSNRAEALLDLHDFDSAEAAFRGALVLFKSINSHRAAAIVEGNLADMMGRQGRFASALQHFEDARRRIEHEGSPGDAARLAGEVAEVQLELGMLDEAARASADAARVLEEQGMIAEAARVRITRGRALAALGHAAEADTVLLQAISEFEAVKQPQRAARAALARAELLFLGTGDVEEARRLLITLLPALRDRPADAARAHAILASIELDARRATPALLQVAAGLKIADSLGLAPLIGHLLHLRGQALLQLNEIKEAIQSLENAADQIERIRGSLQADRFRTAFHARRASVYGDAVTAILRSNAPDRVARAFLFAERSRSRALLDLLSSGGVPPAHDSESPEVRSLSHELARWRARLNALYTALHEVGGVQRSTGPTWQQEIRDAERQISLIESRLASTSRLAGVFGQAVSLDAAMKHIPDDAALLVYFIAGDRLLAFVAHQHGSPRVVDLCSMQVLEPVLRRLRFHIAGAVARGSASVNLRSSSANVNRELQSLHTLLLEAVLEDLPSISQLLIAPYGPLHAVPFHALRENESYLVERFEIVYVPSASILSQLRRQPPRPGSGEPLLVAVADEQAPAIEHEVESLASMLPNARVLRAGKATVSRVIEHSASAPLVHIAAHGIFAEFAPGSSGIRLADGWLTAREAAQMRLDGAVVALSGCETGRSIATEGDELLGLVRAFLAVGASTVLVSLWSVHDAIATDLLVSTYRVWYVEGRPQSGRTLAASLRQAQIELVQQGVHPAFWAPFFLVGTP